MEHMREAQKTNAVAMNEVICNKITKLCEKIRNTDRRILNRNM